MYMKKKREGQLRMGLGMELTILLYYYYYYYYYYAENVSTGQNNRPKLPVKITGKGMMRI